MSARVDLTAGTSSTSVVQTATAAPASGVHDPLVHGYLSAVSVALLLPLSIVLARNFKELNPTVRAPDLLQRGSLARALLSPPFALAAVALDKLQYAEVGDSACSMSFVSSPG